MSASNNLTKKQLQKLFKMLCVHKKEYKQDGYFPGIWQDCEGCILRNVEWQLGEHSPIFRDLCFAIWHEGILEK